MLVFTPGQVVKSFRRTAKFVRFEVIYINWFISVNGVVHRQHSGISVDKDILEVNFLQGWINFSGCTWHVSVTVQACSVPSASRIFSKAQQHLRGHLLNDASINHVTMSDRQKAQVILMVLSKVTWFRDPVVGPVFDDIQAQSNGGTKGETVALFQKSAAVAPPNRAFFAVP